MKNDSLFRGSLAAALFLLAPFCTFLLNAKQDIPPVANQFPITPRSGACHQDLSGDWQLGSLDKTIESLDELSKVEEWIPAARPATVPIALFKAGKMPDPYLHLNSKLFEPLEQKVWFYKKSFRVSEDHRGQFAFLSFDGIDYYSRVWLNGELLGRHEGMFGGPEFEISELLRFDGENELIVAAASANVNNPDYRPNSPGTFIKPWGTAGGTGVEPFFCWGMWRGVRLDFVEKTHLERPFLTTEAIDGETATLRLRADLFFNAHSLLASLYDRKKCQLVDFSGKAPALTPFTGQTALRVVLTRGEKRHEKTFEIKAHEGRGWFDETFLVDKPDLWHPNRLGEPALYNAKVALLIDGKEVDSISFPFGIRRIEWEKSSGEKLADRWGNWQCRVNGKKFFIKGINWMPADALLDLTPEKYRWRLSLARDAGIQLIRIWGAGLQESEDFYNACDEYGIMVWQDFPIGNYIAVDWNQAVAESQFLATIFRLRNRASLAVWCGGNEFNPYNDSLTPMTGILERNLAVFDPSRKFVRTSPDEGSFHAYPDMDPSWYRKNFGAWPFLAESGIHSIASPKGLRAVIEPAEFEHLGFMYKDEFKTLAPETVHHYVEYAPSRVPRMLSRASHFTDLSSPTLDDMALASQLGAGEFYQIFSEGFQSCWPTTVGMMPWVFARSWPTVAAVQLVDGIGQPLAPYYFLKRTYEPVHVALEMDRVLWKAGESFPVAVNLLNLTDGPKQSGKATVRVYDEKLNVLYDASQPIQAEAAPAVSRVDFEPFSIPADAVENVFFTTVEFYNADNLLVSRSCYFPRTMKIMQESDFYENYIAQPTPWPAREEGDRIFDVFAKSPKTTLNIATRLIRETSDGLYRISELETTVQNTGKFPSVMTVLDVSNETAVFVADDNFFSLLPGEKRTLRVRCREKSDLPKSEIQLRAASWNAEISER